MKAVLCIAVALATLLSSSEAKCVDLEDNELTSEGGVLKMNGNRFNLKAASWFGFETSAYVVHGLWSVSLQSLVDFMKNQNFNGVRIPFACELVVNNKYPSDGVINYNVNSDLQGLSSMQIMDKVIDAFANAGIYVMLDMHSLETGGLMNDGLWYNGQYPEDKVLGVWDTLIARYKDKWNVIAIDVFNEPFDATWGTGNTATDFNKWCEKVGDHVHNAGTSWLIMCEGTAGSPACQDGCFYGEDLIGVAWNPVNLTNPKKVVYCPHVYGPDVYEQAYFDSGNFPNNMPAIWSTHWGYIRGYNDHATTVGEWGGSMNGKNGQWMNAIVQYLRDIDAPDNWFWCLNPDSGDTGGLLENDWVTPDWNKLNLLSQLQPNPSKLSLHNSFKHGTAQVCHD